MTALIDMQLSRVKILNFRSLKDIEIDGLKKVNIFMGKNNSGKSSILHAIYFAKNKRDPLSFPFKDCIYSHDESNSILILLETTQGTRKLLHETVWRRDAGVVRIKDEFPVDDIYYIMSDRGIAERSSDISGGKFSDVGLHGEHTGRNMVYIKINEEEKFEKIREFAKGMDIGIKNIDNLLTTEKDSQVTFEDAQNNLKSNILLGGFGQNQLLPIIVQAFDAPPGGVLLYEEPEISLHPAAQRTLLEKFTNFVINEDKQIFLTSHSSYFLNTIERWHRDRNPLLEHIALFNVTRNNGITSVISVQPERIDDVFDDIRQR